MPAIDRRLVLHCAATLPVAAFVPAAWSSAAAHEVPPEVAAELAAPRLQGQGRLAFLGLRVYDARLWTAEGFMAEHFAQHVFALELRYLRRFDGRAIAERSLAEMQRVAEVAPADGRRWLAAMRQAFPDVRDGDCIVGVHRPQQGARFYFNGRLQGEIADAAFAPNFFAIWLSPRTSEPALRQALLTGGGNIR